MLESFGLLGGETVLENATWLSRPEVELIAATGTHLNYLPTASAKLGLGVLDVLSVAEAGVSLNLGTAGGMCNNVNDMFREMLVLALQQRQLQDAPDAVSADRILEMATINGAAALGLGDEIGSLEVGKRADLILIDADAPHMTPMADPVATVVYCARGADVHTALVDGEVVMADRQLLTLDEDDVLEQARITAITLGRAEPIRR